MVMHDSPRAPSSNDIAANHYRRIAVAIAYIQAHFKEQPSLETIANAVHLSPSYLQRIFTQWAGVSPKKFSQYLTLEYAKSVLAAQPIALDDAAHQAGLSGTGRLHDLFVKLEGMTPGEFKHGGAALTINYNTYSTPFGQIFAASTAKGVCQLSFERSAAQARAALKTQFPNATLRCTSDPFQQSAIAIFNKDWRQPECIKLHLRGTDFQLKVWQSLLSIPSRQLTTYGHIAKAIHQPKASRAVGTAIGCNPIAVVIPCHRVIQASGKIGGYRWGQTTKAALIGWEAAQKTQSHKRSR
ncbi:MAG TPA: methylated-DNA--[protein]-cysteine S-methyltransferase [Marinagarivorans sp.]